VTVGPGPAWEVIHHRGGAGDLHAAEAASLSGAAAPLRRSVRLLDATGSAVVLGSTQDPSVLDGQRLRRSGMAWTRRRSGGAAVLVGPGEAAWVDVVVPAADPLWDADVGRATWWLGACWADALRLAGVAGEVKSHRGPLVASRWSTTVCFAGLGPGEVTVAGRKVVGVSQRRTRAGALFQCAVLARWRPADLLDVLDVGDVDRAGAAADLAGCAAGIGPAVGPAVDAFVGSLPGGARWQDRPVEIG
jgi:lipoate-protein ligase A